MQSTQGMQELHSIDPLFALLGLGSEGFIKWNVILKRQWGMALYKGKQGSVSAAGRF
jgi:hypothetical protein